MVHNHVLKWGQKKNSHWVTAGSLLAALLVKLCYLGSLTVHWKHFQGKDIYVHNSWHHKYLSGFIQLQANQHCRKLVI